MWLIFPAVALLVFYPALSGEFIWDDWAYIIQNKLLDQSDALLQIWFSKTFADPWPVSYTLLYFVKLIFGDHAFAYHLFAVVLHSLNSFLVLKILQKLNFRYALPAALLFLIHPVNVESVAWIFQIKTLFAFTLAALAVWAYVNEKNIWVTLGFFMASLLAKPIFICLPLVLIAEEWPRPKSRLLIFSCISCILIYALNSWWYLDADLTEPARTDGVLGRALGLGWMGWFYIYKAFLPFNLSFIYPKWNFSEITAFNWLPTALFAGAVVSLFIFRPKMPRPIFLSGVFWLAGIIPVLGFHDIHYMRFSLVADHWQYAALMGWVCIFAIFFFRNIWLTVFILIAMGELAFFHARNFKTEEALFTAALEQNPKSMIVHDLLGLNYIRKNELDKAMFHFDESLKITPSAQAYSNRGIIFHSRKDLANAMVNYAASDKLNPRNGKLLNNWGAALMELGRNDEAIEKFMRAIALVPEDKTYQYNLNLAMSKKAADQKSGGKPHGRAKPSQ